MSQVIIFADLHCYKHKRSLDRLHHCLEVLEWVFKTAQDRKIKDVIFAGDLFQDREKIDVFTYHLTFKILEKYCHNSINLWLLLGNHDMWFYDKWDISSIAPFSAIDGITFIDKPCTLEIAGALVDFLPYTHDPINHLYQLSKQKNKILIGHIAVDGSQLNTLHNIRSDVVIEHDNEMVIVNKDVFKPWEKVWLGHYHGQQKIGNAEYIGSPLQLNFGEAFQHKHIAIYDLENGKTEYIRNTFSPQHFIIPEKDLDKYDIGKNFIRVEVDDVGSADLIEIKNNLKQQNPGSVEIIPCLKQDQSHIIDDAKAILLKEDEMLKKYVEQVLENDPELKLDKQPLIDVGEMICKGAANA